jgi:hypothetical protein
MSYAQFFTALANIAVGFNRRIEQTTPHNAFYRVSQYCRRFYPTDRDGRTTHRALAQY